MNPAITNQLSTQSPAQQPEERVEPTQLRHGDGRDANTSLKVKSSRHTPRSDTLLMKRAEQKHQKMAAQAEPKAQEHH